MQRHAQFSRRCHLRWKSFSFSIFASALAISSSAQNQRLQTGAGDALQTISLNISVPPPIVAPVLSFDFAFATAESATPGVFLDALSFTLQRKDQAQTGVLLTVDAFGLKLAPPTAGAFELNGDAIRAASIGYFGSLSDPAARSAYHVSVDLPGAFAGDALLLMDLFDNGNTAASVGLVRNVAIVSTPEPGVVALFGLGGVVLAFCRRR